MREGDKNRVLRASLDKLRQPRCWVSLLAALCFALAAFALGKAFRLAPVDDAFISFRCAESFAQGQGPLFNPGERVEAMSNFAYTLLLGLLQLLRVMPRPGANFVNLLSFGAIAFVLFREGFRRIALERGARMYGFIACAAALFSPGFLYYAWSGLETVFYSALLVGGCAQGGDCADKPRRAVAAGFVFGLAAATRIEAAAFLPIAVAALMWGLPRRTALKRAAALGIAFAAVFGPVLVFRYAYFGHLLPNTYYAKVEGGTAQLALRGLIYLGHGLALYAGLALAAALGALRALFDGRDRARSALLAAGVFYHWVLAVAAGGDWFPFYRLLLPALPLAALLFADLWAFGLKSAGVDLRPSFSSGTALAIAVLAVLVSWCSGQQIKMAGFQTRNTPGRVSMGVALRENTPPRTTLLLAPAGAVPYYAERVAHDFYGLTDPVIAHLRIKVGSGIPGHEKADPIAQIERLNPDIIVLKIWLPYEKIKKQLPRLNHIVARRFETMSIQKPVLVNYALRRLKGKGFEAVVAVKRKKLPQMGPAIAPLEPWLDVRDLARRKHRRAP